MRVVRNILGSRWFIFLLGVAVGLWVIPSIKIPADMLKNVLQFVWSQKWGVVIGIVVILLISRLKEGIGGYRIVREDDSRRR